VETGRSRPSRQLLVHLAQRLDLPMAERNRLLLAGGFAPAYLDLPYDGSADAAAARVAAGGRAAGGRRAGAGLRSRRRARAAGAVAGTGGRRRGGAAAGAARAVSRA
jgi:hypothetical protein